MKKQYDKLSQPSVQRYSPALTLDRIWAINADSYYERHYNWSENGVAVPDSQTDLRTTATLSSQSERCPAKVCSHSKTNGSS